MHAPYTIWLLVFFCAPIFALWTFYFGDLWKYRKVFGLLVAYSVVGGIVLDAYAMQVRLWSWPESCCALARVHGLPLEEILFMMLAPLYVSTITIIVRNIVERRGAKRQKL